MAVNIPRVGAVVLAGGPIPSALAHLCAYRALLRVNERYLLAYLLDALHATPEITSTVLVAPEGALPALSVLPGDQVAAGDTLVENMQRGARALAGEGVSHLLFITGDIPLVTPESLRHLLDAGLHSGGALCYPIIPREACEERFPGAKRTYVRIQEGAFTGGNAILVTANLLDDRGALIQSLYAGRKNPLKLAGILGLPTIARMLTGTLSLPYLEGVATRILGAPARAVISPYAEIGFDVDKAEDLAAVEAALRTQKA